jgi:hypothetical protein
LQSGAFAAILTHRDRMYRLRLLWLTSIGIKNNQNSDLGSLTIVCVVKPNRCLLVQIARSRTIQILAGTALVIPFCGSVLTLGAHRIARSSQQTSHVIAVFLNYATSLSNTAVISYQLLSPFPLRTSKAGPSLGRGGNLSFFITWHVLVTCNTTGDTLINIVLAHGERPVTLGHGEPSLPAR